MSRRIGIRPRVDEEWDEEALWAMFNPSNVGSVGPLTERNPPGVPFEPVRHPIGFEIDPAAYRPSSGSGRAKPRKARCRRGKK